MQLLYVTDLIVMAPIQAQTQDFLDIAGALESFTGKFHTAPGTQISVMTPTSDTDAPPSYSQGDRALQACRRLYQSRYAWGA